VDYLHQEYNNNSINYHVNDIELLSLQNKYCEKINNLSGISESKKDQFKEAIRISIETTTRLLQVDFIVTPAIIITPNTFSVPDVYFLYLSYSLVCKYDYEVEDYLDYHFDKYNYNQTEFLNRLKYFGIEQCQKIFPVDNYSLRATIMDWVKSKPIKKSQLNTLLNNNILLPNPQENAINATVLSDESPNQKELYYWKKGVDRLENLYKILLEEEMIEANENFVKSFEDFNVPSKYSTVWNKGETSLLALLYLLYDKERTYNDINREPLAAISNKLFTIKGKKANPKNTYQSFTNFLEKVKSDYYYPKKHRDILAIYQKI